MVRLFIDDERFPVGDNWVIARTSKEAIAIIAKNGIPSFISFDHDLGYEDTTMVVVNYIVEAVLDGELAFPQDFSFYVHSQNPVGAENIIQTLNRFLSYIKYQEPK